MDVLTNKKKRTDYDAISRYSPFSYYYHMLDDKFIYGLTGQLASDIIYVTHKVKPSDTLEQLALRYYGRPDYYWIIADFNRIQDPFISLSSIFTSINIPSLGQVYFEAK